jgi:hypothetical protein
MRRSHLADTNLRGTNFEGANWGDYMLAAERIDLDQAASVYRALKRPHTEAGMYDIAGEFFYREMEARHHLAWHRVPYWRWWLQRRPRPSRLLGALTLSALRFLYGYGERPSRLIWWATGIIFGLAFVHWRIGTVAGGFLEALYYSVVSFTALGYGAWAPEPQGWAGRFLGVGEALMGVFMMALFLVTFTRKMTR